MKLLNKTTNYYLVALIPIYLVSSILFFVVARQLNIHHVDRNLKEDKELIIQHTKTDHPKYIESELSHDFFIKHIPNDSIVPESISSIEEYDTLADEIKPYRQLITSIEYDGIKYEVILRKSLVENSTFLYSLSLLFIVLVGFSVTLFLYLKRKISAKIWAPFYTSLHEAQAFEVGQNMAIKSLETDIDEFNELQNTLEGMTRRIDKDFVRQKEFIDTISHELQTPISIISMHLENIMQRIDLSPEEAKDLQVIQDTTQRLSRMNKTLLLLSKIKNHQYTNREVVIVADAVRAQIDHFQHMLEMKKITLTTEMDESVATSIDPVLMEILMSNLFQNAIRHNVEDGEIFIEITEDTLIIENTGPQPSIDPETVFNKFTKTNNEASIGLGMSIVRGICDTMHYSIHFTYDRMRKRYRISLGHLC